MQPIVNKQRIVEALFKSGRVHIAGGDSLFKYPGAIFSAADFEAENAERLQKKLRTAAELQIKIEEFDKANPDYQYTKKLPHSDDVINSSPAALHDEAFIIRRMEALHTEVLEKLKSPQASSPQAQSTKLYLGQQLLKLPSEELQWLQSSDTELVYTNDKSYNPEGKVIPGNYASLYPDHPAFDFIKTGGGSLAGWGGPIQYCYASAQRDPKVLVAHELLGHGLHSASIKLHGEQVDQTAYNAIARDLGDLNKRVDAAPDPNRGRLGEIIDLVNSSQDPLEFYHKAKAFDPDHTPAFRTDEGRRFWAKGMSDLARAAESKMGANGWMYKAECYNSPQQQMKELVAAYAELKYVEGAEHPDQLKFLLPAMSQFWEQYPARAMQEQLAEAKAKEEAVQAEKPAEKPLFKPLSLSSQNTSPLDALKKPSAAFFITSALALAAIPLFGWAIPLAIAAGSFGLGVMNKMQEDKAANNFLPMTTKLIDNLTVQDRERTDSLQLAPAINYRNDHAAQYLASKQAGLMAERTV